MLATMALDEGIIASQVVEKGISFYNTFVTTLYVDPFPLALFLIPASFL
jgi:hypothetical protein